MRKVHSAISSGSEACRVEAVMQVNRIRLGREYFPRGHLGILAVEDDAQVLEKFRLHNIFGLANEKNTFGKFDKYV